MSRCRAHGAVTKHEDQQLLALVEAQVGSLIELLPVALVVTSATGEVLRANPAAAALLGSRETLVGQPIKDMLRGRHLWIRVRILSYAAERVRLYVLQQRNLLAAVRERERER